MTEATNKKKFDPWWLHFAIIFFLMFIVHYFIKPFSTLSQEGINVLCIFAGLIYGWGFYGLLIPSLMAMVALGYTGLYTVSQIVVQGFGNDIVIFALLMFVVVGLMNELGITKIFAAWLLKRKFLQGRPWAFSAMMCFVAYVVTALSNNFIAMFLVWGMWYSIFKSYDFKPHTPYVNLMMFGTIVGVTLGSFILPFHGTALIMIGSFQGMSPQSGNANLAIYMLAVIPVTLLLFSEYFLISKFLFKPDISQLKEIDTQSLIGDAEIGNKQKVTIAVFIMIILALLLPTFLSDDNILKLVLAKMGFSGIALSAILALSIIRIDQKPIMNFGAIAKDAIVWDAVFMMVVIMLLSPILSNPATGINAFIVQLLTPILGGHSPFIFMVIFAGMLFFLTNFFNNMIMGFLFMNIVVAFAEPLGINPWILVALLCIAMHLAILTPSASGQVGMVFGMNEWIDGKWLYKATSATFIVWAVTFLTVGISYVRLIYGLFD